MIFQTQKDASAVMKLIFLSVFSLIGSASLNFLTQSVWTVSTLRLPFLSTYRMVHKWIFSGLHIYIFLAWTEYLVVNNQVPIGFKTRITVLFFCSFENEWKNEWLVSSMYRKLHPQPSVYLNAKNGQRKNNDSVCHLWETDVDV